MEACVEEIKASIYNCIFCNKLLDDKSNILACLHLICVNCVEKHTNNSSIQCKCQMVTENKLIDFPIILPDITISYDECKVVSCHAEASRKCSICNVLYCEECSKVHLSTEKNHTPDVMTQYPTKEEFISCANCIIKPIEVYCTECLVMICCMCHLKNHRFHTFKEIAVLRKEIMCNFARQNDEFEVEGLYLNHFVGKFDDQFEKVKLIKKAADEEIYKQFYMLFAELKNRKQIVLNLVEKHILNINTLMKQNKFAFEKLQNENKYYKNLTELILKNGQTMDVISLSKIFMSKIISFKNYSSNIPEEILKSNIELNLNWDESIKNCRLSIESLGKQITTTSVLDFLEFLNAKNKTTNSVSQATNGTVQDRNFNEIESVAVEINNQILQNSIEDDELQVKCLCCSEWSKELITCISCKKSYHKNCHIPLIPDCYSFTIYDSSTIRWKCTLCDDIAKYCTVINQNASSTEIPINKMVKKILERLLMELYSQNDESVHFIKCIEKDDPLYLNYVSNPISLNDIKENLDSDSYRFLNDVIKDIKRIFSNALSYYPNTHPYNCSALVLQEYLSKLLTEWLPKLDLI